MIHFPAICVDNFYSDPDQVRNWALSLEYKTSPGGQWPGKRTEKLHLIDQKFFNDFCCKIFSLYFDLSITDLDYVVHTQFQLITPYDTDPTSPKNSGWIHYDVDNIFGGIVYLTPDINLNCGTSVFRQDRESIEKNHKTAKQTFYNTGRFAAYDKCINDHNSCFTETINYKNIYNRMVSFDCETAHKANSFYSEVPRLTQVFFVDKCESRSEWPMSRHKRYL